VIEKRSSDPKVTKVPKNRSDAPKIRRFRSKACLPDVLCASSSNDLHQLVLLEVTDPRGRLPWTWKLASASKYSPVDFHLMAKHGREQLDELQFRAWRAFVYAHATVVPTLDQELAGAQGLSLNEFEILTWLARAGRRGLRMSDLASRVVLSPSGVTRAVDHLERKGLVERCVFDGDKRGYLAALTVDGRAVLRQATNVHMRGLREHFFNHLSRTELEHLATALETLLAGEGSLLQTESPTDN
jgi:DNA-binding MarR family transcriptional regulator